MGSKNSNAGNAVPCKTCGKTVARSAKLCPHCGEEVPGINPSTGAAVAIFLVGWFVAWLIYKAL